MGGESGVTSIDGEGSVFWFSARFAISSKKEEPAEVDARVLSNRRVLVVDDNATNRKVLSQQLMYLGMSPDCVDGADAAMHALDAEPLEPPFELAVLDYMMPGCDGLELGDFGGFAWCCSPPPAGCTAPKSWRSWVSPLTCRSR
jgi:hypothetical protein